MQRKSVFAICLAAMLVCVFINSTFAFWPFGGGKKVVLSIGEELSFSQDDKSITLQYKKLELQDTSFPGRQRGALRIQASRDLVDADDETVKEIVRALKEKNLDNAKAISVFIHFPPRSDGMADIAVHYAEDGKGFSGSDDWEWKIERHTEALDA